MTKRGNLLQIPIHEVICDTKMLVDCMDRKQLKVLQDQLLKAEVVFWCAD